MEWRGEERRGEGGEERVIIGEARSGEGIRGEEMRREGKGLGGEGRRERDERRQWGRNLD